ncbi:MAG TPA: hypothetical protein VIX37_12185, partial [Candidatus Sulfotelmatobacter sp.]
DAVRRMLAAIQASGQDGEEDYAPRIELPARLQDSQPTGSAAATSGTSPEVLPPPPPQPAAQVQGTTIAAETTTPSFVRPAQAQNQAPA